MDATEAAQMAREHLCRVPGMQPYLGFEVIDMSRFDWNEWEVECLVFSTRTSKMTKYLVVISDDKVRSSTEWIE